jgi:3-oxosteroid 1-dehydrogenase
VTTNEHVDTDVAVIGSGAAALVAAVTARHGGAEVTVLEKSRYVGGTTALSGGLVWVPGNHHLRAAGLEDSFDDACKYVGRLAAGRRPPEVIRAVLGAAPAMVEFVESTTGLRFEMLDKPDYHPEFPGARVRGRCLAAQPMPGDILGDRLGWLRPSSGFAMPLSWGELDAMNGVFHPERLDMALIQDRAAAGYIGMGRALAGWLLQACLDRGVDVLLELRADALLMDGSRVAGVHAVRPDGSTLDVRARRGTVMACGGFEWNDELCRQFVAGPLTHPLSCPTNEGDGLRMGMAIGADLANMWDLWRFPAAAIPGETYEGRPLARMVVGERALPGAILVNRDGQRFVNEAHPYTDIGRSWMTWDPVEAVHRNDPSWAVFDHRFRSTYAVLSLLPTDDDPSWLVKADTVAELAASLGIDPAALGTTVERWNAMVAAGHDDDFRRGESLFDHYYADWGHEPDPTLGAIGTPPFYALRVHPGAIGSSGGLRTDEAARVLHVGGEPIPGLYAAGDAAASPSGPGYGGPGAPLGMGMTSGYLAGGHATGG